MVSFDIVNLFLCVLLREVYSLLEHHLAKKKFNPLESSELLILFNLSLNQIFFYFQGKVLKQTDGLAMGSAGSLLEAEV